MKDSTIDFIHSFMNRNQETPLVSSDQVRYKKFTFDLKKVYSNQLSQRFLNYTPFIQGYQQINLHTIKSSDLQYVKEAHSTQLSFRQIFKKVRLDKVITQSMSKQQVEQIDQQQWGRAFGEDGNLPLIIHIRFSVLKTLNLSYLRLNNVEALTFLDAPFLEVLQLQKNHICSLKPLQKSQLYRLTDLSYHQNHIKELNHLNKGKFSQLINYENGRFSLLKNRGVDHRSSKTLRQNQRQQKEMLDVLQLFFSDKVKDSIGQMNYSFFVKMQRPIIGSIQFDNQSVANRYIPLLEKLNNYAFIKYG